MRPTNEISIRRLKYGRPKARHRRYEASATEALRAAGLAEAPGSVTEIVFTWPDGREEVRYRRPEDSESALLLIEEIIAMTKRLGTDIPYSYRHCHYRTNS